MTVFEKVTASPETLASHINMIARCDANFELQLAEHLKQECCESWENYEPADYDIDLIRKVNAAVKNIGKYIVWNNGVCNSLKRIYAVIIDDEHVRYDLGLIQPVTEYSAIVKIVDESEAITLSKNGDIA